ncbi:ATP-binding protein [Dactylosporangium sp. NPDC049525]|uniref:ATP-binding protein n=1 Tax=Dactylosporangium sp. NPDC049525 TaxID=3154730 RepID=UPI003444E5B6
MDYLSDVDDATIEIRVRGRWSRRLQLELSRGVDKALAEAPRAALLDLSGLIDPHGESIPTLLDAQRSAAAVTPSVRLMVCAGAARLSRRLDAVRAGSRIPTFDSVRQARMALRSAGLVPVMHHIDLPPDYVSAALARDWIGQVCSDWRLEHLLHTVRLVVSELALNAIEHAATPFTVTLSLRGAILHLAVRDQSSMLPTLMNPGSYDPGGPLADRGRGLRLVAAHAIAWGATPCRVGKVVWATLKTPVVRP